MGPSVTGEGRVSAHERVFRHESRWYHGQFVRPEPKGSGRFCFRAVKTKTQVQRIGENQYEQRTAKGV